MPAVEHDIDLVYVPDQGCQNQHIGKLTAYTYIQYWANSKPKMHEPSTAELATVINLILQNPQQRNSPLGSIFGLEVAYVDNNMQANNILDFLSLADNPKADDGHLKLEDDRQRNRCNCKLHYIQTIFG